MQAPDGGRAQIGALLTTLLSLLFAVVAPLVAGSVVGRGQAPDGERPAADSLVAHFYEARGGRLAWIDSRGVSPQTHPLLRALSRAAADGLDDEDYPTAALDSLLALGTAPERQWPLDSLLTFALFAYGSDLSQGRVAPALVDSLWRAAGHETNLVARLEEGIESGRIAALLGALAPPDPGYAALRRGLARYREIAARGGWRVLAPGAPLELGRRAPQVLLLRRRLAAEGYAVAADSAPDVFDAELDVAVREFQGQHGLTPDGSVGSVTRRALNRSAGARVEQIALNLERWRWLPRYLGARYVMVNTAAFTLDVVDGGQPRLSMRAIVGRRDRQTPIVSSRLTEVIFRPVWYVPRGIATQEILPALVRDPGYLAREGIRVYSDSAARGREVDPTTIDWRAVTESTFHYQLAQEPGPTNPLGGVKFGLWTPFDVFIHDTPVQPLFTERLRAFSHGCVRIEGAAVLAAYLLPGWSADSIAAAMHEGRERRVPLPDTIPVHFVYFTAWIDAEGEIQFRDDAYAWDARLANALATRASRRY